MKRALIPALGLFALTILPAAAQTMPDPAMADPTDETSYVVEAPATEEVAPAVEEIAPDADMAPADEAMPAEEMGDEAGE